jgi:hypothetical protein
MKTFLMPLLGALLLLSSTGCKKEEAEFTPDTVVFGSFYGECLGEKCIEMYKLDVVGRHLYEGTQDQYPAGATPYGGSFVQLPDSLYPKVSDLPALIPAQLRREPNAVFGQPDAGDWGGYYLEVTHDGRQQVWLIDTQKSNIPTYLHPLVDQLEAKLRLIP